MYIAVGNNHNVQPPNLGGEVSECQAWGRSKASSHDNALSSCCSHTRGDWATALPDPGLDRCLWETQWRYMLSVPLNRPEPRRAG